MKRQTRDANACGHCAQCGMWSLRIVGRNDDSAIAPNTPLQSLTTESRKVKRMRKFTYNEVTRLCGTLHLYTVSYFCEICDGEKRVETTVVTTTGVPIFTCLTCALRLMTISASHHEAKLRADKTNGVKRGRPRKAVKVK
jgi:hypothetical protein